MWNVTIKQRAIRLAGIAGLTLGLALSTGVAAAQEVGYTECNQTGCAIANATKDTGREFARVVVDSNAPGNGPLGPHLIP